MFHYSSARSIAHMGAVMLLLVVIGNIALADVPRLISYQGRMTDDMGNPLDTTIELTFNIYSDSTGGLILWTETHPTVPIEEGLFTVRLGSITPFGKTVFDGSQRWLRISLEGGGVLEPRTPIVSTAYAIRSQRSDTATFAASADLADHALTSQNADTAAFADSADWADHALTSQHADTADIALNVSSGGWTDAGTIVSLSTLTDSVGIGTNDPRVPLEVQGPVIAIIGESHGSGLSAGVLGGNDNDGIGVMGTSNDGRGVSGISITGFGGHFFGPKNFISSNLGIGTEMPDDMLHIYTDGSGAESFIKVQSDHASNWGEAGIRFQTPQNIWRLRMDDDANGQIPDGAIGLRNQMVGEVMTWTDNGRVGIGTTGPNYPLEVVASGNTLRARCTGSGIGVYTSSISGFGVYSDAPENFMGGLTGFGQTSPTHRITVNGAIGIQKNGTTKYHLLYYNSGFSISETTVADYRLYVKDGGNVGIGTSNPQAKLHVAGMFHADAFETDAINKDNILDEPGLTTKEFWNNSTPSSTWATLGSDTINAPAGGYALVIATFQLFADHGATGGSAIACGLAEITDSVKWYHSYKYSLGTYVDADWYDVPVTIHRIFTIPSAGTYNYYFLAKNTSDNPITVYNRDFTVIYIPSAHGSIRKDNLSPADESIAREIDHPDMYRSSAYNSNRSRSDGDSDRLLEKLDALTAEVEALRAKVEAIEEE